MTITQLAISSVLNLTETLRVKPQSIGQADLTKLRLRAHGVLNHLVTAKGIYASSALEWSGPYHAYFGRDTAITSALVLEAETWSGRYELAPRALSALFQLAQFQGTRNNSATGEELGKIPHEVRTDWNEIQELQARRHQNGEKLWHVSPVDHHLKNWDSNDSTPLWLIAIGRWHENGLRFDKDIKNDKAAGRLLGVPFVAKDNFLTHDTHTTAASNILKPFKAPYQATAIEKLEAEGAIMLAKTNLDAFAHGSSTENSDFGPTHNPFDFEYVPGGSSGGSAAAVALGLAAFGLGTDTGGSIRLPASFCGVVGLKPTYGLVSRYGVIAMASSTDTIGPLARSVEDAALVLDVISGRDRYDGTTIERDGQSYTDLQADLKGLKIGIIKEHLATGVDKPVAERVAAVAEQLKAGGAQVEEVSIPVDELALAVYYILVPAEVSSNLARYDGVKYGHSSAKAVNLEELYELSRAEGFGDEAKRRILIGTYVLSSGYYDAYYKQAQTVRTLLIEAYKQAFAKYDVLLGPTSPTLPFKLGQRQDPLAMYLSDVATVGVNLTGIPGISVPVGSHDGLPIGIHLMTDQHQERKLLGIAQLVQEMTHA